MPENKLYTITLTGYGSSNFNALLDANSRAEHVARAMDLPLRRYHNDWHVTVLAVAGRNTYKVERKADFGPGVPLGLRQPDIDLGPVTNADGTPTAQTLAVLADR